MCSLVVGEEGDRESTGSITQQDLWEGFCEVLMQTQKQIMEDCLEEETITRWVETGTEVEAREQKSKCLLGIKSDFFF